MFHLNLGNKEGLSLAGAENLCRHPLTCWPWASGPPALGHVHTLTPHKGKQMSPVGASGSLLHAGVFQKLSQKRGVCTLWEPPHSLFSMIKVNFQIFNSTWPGT